MNKLPIFEFVFDETLFDEGLSAVSIVDEPAIVQEFLMFSEQKEIQKFVVQNDEEQVLVGPALVSGMLIYRYSESKGDYYGFFSEETIKQLVTNYFKTGKINSFTYQHENQNINGLTIIESWFVGEKNDKSIELGYNLPKGSWMISVKVEDKTLWDKIKKDNLKGFSVEVIADAIPYSEFSKQNFQVFNDYPQGISDEAERGIRLNEENGNKCATQVGKIRARQLANRENISYETVKRMYSYLSRAAEYYNPNDTSACGTISYLLWGGEPALRWSERIINQVEREKDNSKQICSITNKDVIKSKLKKTILEAEIERIYSGLSELKLERWNNKCDCFNCIELSDLGWCLPKTLPDNDEFKEYNIVN